jgi:hypothetical protein
MAGVNQAPWRTGASDVQPPPTQRTSFSNREIHLFRVLLLSLLLAASSVYAGLPLQATDTVRQMEEYVGEEKTNVDILQKPLDLYEADTVPNDTEKERKKKNSPAA